MFNSSSPAGPADPSFLRRKQSAVFTLDPRSGRPVIIPEFEQALSLSDDDSLDSASVYHDRFVCRHDPRSAPAGWCSVCSGLVCTQCLHPCSGCLRPVCPRDAKLLDVGQACPMRVCRGCYDGERRRRRAHRLTRAIMRPFLVLDGGCP